MTNGNSEPGSGIRRNGRATPTVEQLREFANGGRTVDGIALLDALDIAAEAAPDWLYYAGVCLGAAERMDAAVDLLKRAAAGGFAAFWCAYHLGLFEMKRDRPLNAAYYFTAALIVRPEHALDVIRQTADAIRQRLDQLAPNIKAASIEGARAQIHSAAGAALACAEAEREAGNAAAAVCYFTAALAMDAGHEQARAGILNMAPDILLDLLPAHRHAGNRDIVPDTTLIEIVRGDERYSFECFNNYLSKLVCGNILNGETYRPVPFIADVRSIVDIGANVGAASVYFALAYPLAEVHAFEPDPASFDILTKNSKNFRQIHPSNFGLFDADCTKILYQGDEDNVTASVRSSALNTPVGREVILRNARTVLSSVMRPDIIKIDTEGCEVPILYNARDLILQARLIYLEYHSEMDRKTIDCLLGETHALFQGTIYNPHRGELCYVRRDACPPNEFFWLEITS